MGPVLTKEVLPPCAPPTAPRDAVEAAEFEAARHETMVRWFKVSLLVMGSAQVILKVLGMGLL